MKFYFFTPKCAKLISKKSTLTFFIVLSAYLVFGQVNGTPDPCTDGSQNTCTCEGAPILCAIDELDGYSYGMTTYLHAEDGPDPMCTGSEGAFTTSHNPTWFAFLAWCEELTLKVKYDNCEEGEACSSYGIQAAVYSDCSLDPSSAVACDTSVDGCEDDEERVIDISGMTIGDTYYFLVDGCCGSACDILITVEGDCGLGDIGPWTQDILGPCVLCDPSGPVTYSIAEIHPGAVNYRWYVGGFEQADGAPLLDWTYTFPGPGEYEICLDVDNKPCINVGEDPEPLCKMVLVLEGAADAGDITATPNPTCPGETITFSTTNYNDFDTQFEQWMFVTDVAGEILVVFEGDNGDFTHEYCGTYFVYSYNYYLEDDYTVPVVGEFVDDFNLCEACFCELINLEISFEDTEMPVFLDPPGDVTTSCILELDPVGQLTYTDNCIDGGSVTGIEEGSATICDGGEYTRTWTKTDSCGNVGTHIQTITIEIVPVAVFTDVPGDESLSCADLVDGEIYVNYTNGLEGDCEIMGSVLGEPDGPIDICGGTVTFTWEFEDECMRTISATQAVTYDPPLPIVFSDVPADVTIGCDELPFMPIDLDYTNNDVGDCFIDGTEPGVIEGDLLVCDDVIIITWTAIDGCGQSFDTTQMVTLEDTEAPEFTTTPADETYDCYLDVPIAEDLTWTDNCDGTNTVSPIEDGTIDECTGGSITRTWEYTDICGINSVTHTQTITVNPVPDVDWTSTLPEDMDIVCGEDLPDPVDLDFSNGSPSDNCLDEDSISPTEMGTFVICGDQIIRTWEYSPTCGPAISHTQTFTLIDVDDPEFINPPEDETFFCYAEVPVGTDLVWEDNCDGSGSVPFVEEGTIDECTGGTITRTWEYTDACDNTETHIQTITVDPVPNIDWMTTLPEDITVQCGDDIDPAINLDFSNGLPDSGCLEEDTVSPEEMGELIICGDQIIRNWEYTPECGPILTHTQTITLEDMELPVFIDPPVDADYNCYLDVPMLMDLVWEDNCDGTGMVPPVEEGTIDECTGGMITRTWEYTDACDNTETHIQTITVNPVPDLEWTSTLPEDITVQCDEVINDPIDINYSNNSLSPNCLEDGIQPMTLEEGELLVCGDQIIRTWEVIPACGPTLTHTQTITLEDMELPIFLDAPSDEEYDCYINVPLVMDLVWEDNCDGTGMVPPVEEGMIDECTGGMITRTWEYTDACDNTETHIQTITVNPVPDIMWISATPGPITLSCSDEIPAPEELEYSNNSPSTDCLEGDMILPTEEGELLVCGDQIVRTWEVIPACGPTLTHTQTITLQDVEAPVFVDEPDLLISLDCILDLPPLVDLEWMDNCDGTGTVPPVEDGTLDPCTGGSITRTWEYTDLCGNGPVTFTQVISLTAPVQTACDDDDDCTINDMVILDCEGNICEECMGEITGCSGVTELLPCDDDDDCTINDMREVACDGTECAPCQGEITDCDDGITFERVCSDMDPCTINDIEIIDCQENICVECAGTPNPTPDPTIDDPGPTCEGETQTIFADGCVGGTLNWYDMETGGTLIFVGNPFVTPELSEETTYWVECVIDGCVSNIVSITIGINSPITTTITGDAEICEGTSTFLDAGDGFINYQWDPSGFGQVIEVDESGTYTVTVTDVNGCESTASFNVEVLPLPEPEISGSLTFCVDGETTLSVQDIYDAYEWGPNGETTISIIVDMPGTYSVTVTDENGCMNAAEVIVIEAEELEPIITGGPDFCTGETITLTPGDSFNSYLWAPNGETTKSIEVSTPGVYSVSVTLAGCEGNTQIEIFENPLPEPMITGDLFFCPGESTFISAFNSDYIDYDWENGSFNSIIEVDEEGEYFITVTDVNGCMNSTSAYVTELDEPIPEITGDLMLCPEEVTILTATTGFSGYLWMPNGETTESINVTDAGTYTVEVTDDNGCIGTTSVNVGEIFVNEVFISGSSSFCTDGFTEIDAGNGWNSYVWLPNGETTQTIEVDIEGTYTVQVTDENGCTNTASIEVTEETELMPFIYGDLAGCEGGLAEIFVNGNFTEYEWSTGEDESTIEVAVGGTYSITVTDASGCMGEATVEIGIIETDPVTIEGDDFFCEGTTTTISASDGFDTYEWSNSINTQSITVNVGGVYTVTATNSFDCEAIASIEVFAIPQPELSISGTTNICNGEEVVLDAGIFNEYEWSTGEMTQTITVSAGGAFEVTVTDENGCQADDAVIINEFPTPAVSIAGSNTYCINGSTNLSLFGDLTDITSILWTPGGQTSANVDIGMEGTIYVQVTDINGCIAMDSIEITEEESLSPIINEPDLLCPGGTITLTVGNFETYEWSTGDITNSIDVSLPGTYSVTVFDNTGCDGETSVEVVESTPEQVMISGDPFICLGATTEITAEGDFVSFEWTGNLSNQSIIVNTTGIYSVTATDINGCESIASIEITTENNPDPTILGGPSFCSGLVTTLSLDESYDTYEWSTGDFSETLDVSTVGQYSVLVIDANGCEGRDTIQITEYPEVEVMILGSPAFCEGGVSILDATDGTTDQAFVEWEWSTGDMTQTIETDVEGIISVTVTDINGCMGTASVMVSEEESLQPQISGSDFCEGSSSELSAASLSFISWEWSTGEMTESITITEGDTYFVTVEDAGGCSGVGEITIEEIPNPVVTIEGPSSLCNGETITLSTNEEFNTYLWNTSEVTQSISISTPGVYSVTVTNNQNCSAIATTEVTLQSAPMFTIVDVECTEDMGNYLLWFSTDADSIVAQNQTLDDVGNMEYQITNIDTSEGIVLELYFTPSLCDTTIMISPPNCSCTAVADAGIDGYINCIDLSATLGGSNSTIGSDYTVEWYDENGVLVSTDYPFITTVPGTYTLSIFDAVLNCTETSMVLVEDLTNEISTTILAEPDNIIDCIIDTIVLSYEEDLNIVYTWFIDGVMQNGPTIIITEAGDIVLSAVDTLTGCVGDASISIENQEEYPLIEILNPEPLSCLVTSVTIDATNSQGGSTIIYQWFDEDGNAIEGAIGNSFTVNEPGIYFFESTDTENSCNNRDSIEVISIVSFPDIDAGQNSAIPCDGTDLFLNGIINGMLTDFDILWTTSEGLIESGEMTITPEVGEPGWYFVEVTNTINGCSSMDSLFVEANNPPNSLMAINLDPDCYNANTGLISLTVDNGGVSPFTYFVNGQENNTGNFENLSAGSYSVQVLDAVGCSFDTTLTLENPSEIFVQAEDPVVQINYGSGTTIVLETNVLLGDIDTIIWEPMLENGCGNCLEITIDELFENQDYLVTLIDENGCIDTTEIRILLEGEVDIFIPNVISTDADGDNGIFFPQTGIEGVEVLEMYIFDRWGEMVYYNENFPVNDPTYGWDGRFNGQNAISGVYVYYLRFDAPGIGIFKRAGDVTLVR